MLHIELYKRKITAMTLTHDTGSKFSFSGPLAAKVQNSKARKLLALAAILYGGVCALVPAYVAWLFITPASAGVGTALAAGAVAITAPALERLLFISIQTALPIKGQPYDERQQQLYTAALVSARNYTVALIACLFLAGLAAAYYAASLPLAHIVPTYVWTGVTLLFLAFEFPYILLAWRLPIDLEADND